MTEITMPKLSDSMEAGTILSWLKADGEDVRTGEELVEIETDKATVTHVAEASGVLTIVAPEGTSLPVGATIARVAVGAAVPAPSPNGQPTADSGVALPASEAVPVRGNGKVSATPLARRVAAAHGVAIADVPGSGPRGRVTRADVLRTAGLEEAPPAPAPTVPEAPAAEAPAPAPAPSAKGDVEVVEPTRLQGVVARRMAEAKATIPDFQVQTEVVMDAAIAFRAQLKATGAQAPSFNDLIVKAAAIALREYPRANGAWRDGRFEEYSRVNVGIAVAAEGVLVVPTIFDVDSKALGAIAAEARRLAGRVRDGSVTPAELSGGTFTVSNLGMYGMTAITPVINVPQAAILGVGTLRETLARIDGEIVDRTLMTLTLSCDHRILYGAEAAQFLSRIRDLLETPIKLAL
jgi:pyruvate dehydrogenase E2 component (dihydrolipoamide acetyltransferase)